MTQVEAVKLFRAGLLMKLIAMWLLVAGLVLPFLWVSENALLVAVLIPVLLDLAGRCCCGFMPNSRHRLIQVSILAQIAVVIVLIAFWASMPNGVLIGLLCAIPCQVAAALLFTYSLESIAASMERPDLVEQLQKLRREVFRSSIMGHFSFLWTLILGAAALIIGLFMYGLGLIFTIPVAFLGVLPFWGATVAFAFMMLFRYEMSLHSLRAAMLTYQPVDSGNSSSGEDL